MAPINSGPPAQQPQEQKPAAPTTEAACVSLYGYQPTQAILDRIFGRNEAQSTQEKHAIQIPGIR